MTWRRALPLIAVLVALAVAGGRALPGDDQDRSSASPADAVVTRVVDGDTIHVSVGGHDEAVRYIGMDTPETKKPGSPIECFGKAASAENERLVTGRHVRLVYDAERRDRYGRLLAYVYRRPDGLFVNAELVRRGFATLLTIPPNVAHAELFRRLQRTARESNRGLWGSCRLT
jgi:micrococcal nuclease